MKKSLSLFALSFILINLTASYAAISRTPTQNGEKLNFSLSLKNQEISLLGKNFTEYSIIGAKNYSAILYREGFPKIPVIRFYVYADSAQDISVHFSSKREHLQKLSPASTLIPNIPAIPKIPSARAFLTLDQTVYTSGIYPLQNYTVESAGYVRGQKRQLVSIYPLQYFAQNRSLLFRSTFSVDVKNNSQNEEKNILKPTFLFIVGEKFKDQIDLKNYQEHKEAQGFNVENIVVTKENKKSEKIREEIRKIYSDAFTDLRYALIIGDHEDVPGHKGKHIYGVTDHYYKCLDTIDYEEDLNAPDIALGRLSAATKEQLKDILNKHLRYEQERSGTSPWLQSASFIATNDQWKIAEGTHNYVIDHYLKDLGFTGQFPNSNIAGGDLLYAISNKAKSSDLRHNLNLGRGIINYSGHGQTTSWLGPEFKISDVKNLNHADALPMVISNACITGKFTVSESFAEAWQRHPNGAIMFWGSMDNTYWQEDDVLEKRLFDGIYQTEIREFGAMTDYALAEFWRHYGGDGRSKYYYETYILFADPQQELRTL